MLLQFKVNNFCSIKETVIFSMNTAGNKEIPHSFVTRGYHLLNSAVIFGANASGKSNVLKAVSFMRELVLNRSKVTQSVDKLPHQPFRLNSETENSSSAFEMIFFKDNAKYRYGFEADSETVYAEWLFVDERGREARLFERDTETELLYINKQKFKEGNGVKVPNNQLFIWRCDQQDGDISKAILQWFESLNFIDGLKNESYLHVALKQVENDEAKSELLALLQTADLGIDDIKIEEQEVSWEQLKDLPIEIKQFFKEAESLTTIELQTSHKKFDKDNQLVGNVVFELGKEESAGTQKFFALSAPILDTLRTGKTLLIDELDASLHPQLSAAFIKLFHNPKYNKHNAQLIFATHDTHLLSSPELFEREQIWFTEKDQYGCTDLYSLLEFRKKNKGKDIRGSDNLEKHYLQGRFGSTPNLGDF
ncbi:MAG: AAA family ATPase [Methyloprofundus sp.]|nr:AAA family ATPase [Methyloprofundus sp.]